MYNIPLNIALIMMFILIGGVYAAAEIALVSLRDSQVKQLAHRGRRGRTVARLHQNPNRFLSAVQVGVTLAGFLSAAFGGATLVGVQLIAMAMGPEWRLQTLSLVFMGWGFYMIHGSLQVFASELSAEARATALSLHAFFFFMGQTIGPIAYGFGIQHAGKVPTLLTAAAIMIALGTDITGAMGNDDALVEEIVQAGRSTGDWIWPLPLHKEYRRLIDSNIADIKNIGERWGDAAIGEILNNATTQGVARAFQRQLGLTLHELSDEWRESINAKYLPQAAQLDRPRTFAQPLLTERRSGGQIFLAPALSSDGRLIAFLSNGAETRGEVFIDLWLADARTGGAYALHEVIGEPEPDRPGCQSQYEALGEQLPDESWT